MGFSKIVGIDEIVNHGLDKKPSGDPYIFAVSELQKWIDENIGVRQLHCLAYEDSGSGLKAGVNAFEHFKSLRAANVNFLGVVHTPFSQSDPNFDHYAVYRCNDRKNLLSMTRKLIIGSGFARSTMPKLKA